MKKLHHPSSSKRNHLEHLQGLRHQLEWYHNWKVHGDKPDAAEEFIQNLAHAMAVDLETPADIIFPTVYTLLEKMMETRKVPRIWTLWQM